MDIGLDIHGVIDRYPNFFREMSIRWKNDGHTIHIITGQEWAKASKDVEEAGILYDKSFSIVDYHKEFGTKMWQDDKGTWWMSPEEWVQSKGMYAKEFHIQIHFDDSIEYAEHFPSYCTFIHVPRAGFGMTMERFFKLGLDL